MLLLDLSGLNIAAINEIFDLPQKLVPHCHTHQFHVVRTYSYDNDIVMKDCYVASTAPKAKHNTSPVSVKYVLGNKTIKT